MPQQTTEQALLLACRNRDDGALSVYADWLEERAYNAKAAFLRDLNRPNLTVGDVRRLVARLKAQRAGVI